MFALVGAVAGAWFAVCEDEKNTHGSRGFEGRSRTLARWPGRADGPDIGAVRPLRRRPQCGRVYLGSALGGGVQELLDDR